MDNTILNNAQKLQRKAEGVYKQEQFMETTKYSTISCKHKNYCRMTENKMRT